MLSDSYYNYQLLSTAMSKINRISIRDVSKQHHYLFGTIPVYTPHQLYESQKTFIQYVIKCLNSKQNALVQSPTGTGKTLSLLCSTLAWAMHQQQTTNREPPQIIYASRTHAQLKQVAKEINQLCYDIKLAILGSRDQTCVNDDLKLLRGQDKELECRLRIAQKKGLKCNFYQHEGYYQKQGELGKIMDIQQISVKGRLQHFCPFFYQRYSKAIANIVLIPYNYLFDKKIWTNQQGFRLQGSILILDEAHNIQSVCQQYHQFSISLSTMNRALQQLGQLRQQKLSENNKKLDPGTTDKTKMLKVEFEDIQINASSIEHIGQFLQTLDIPSGSEGLLLNSKQFVEIIQVATNNCKYGSIFEQIEKIIQRFQQFRADLMFKPFWTLESWMRFVQKMQELQKNMNSQISQFKIQILYEGSDIKINILCLDPSSGFKDVIEQHKPRSIILTSGTLSPLKVWPLELKVNFANPLSCPHILSPKQTETIMLGIGPSGNPLNTSFQNRKNPQLYDDIGKVLYQIVKNTPNGVVALFPSYSFLQQTKINLTNKKILTQIYQRKNVYFEKKDSSDFANVLDRYMKDAQSQKGALLCALIRGKISEGLDFSHKKCRAVVLVGVPYPYSKDVKVTSKMQYLDSIQNKIETKGISGTQWYLAQTVRAINQGIGRLIRSPTDFGIVYLLDERFAKPDIEAQLASWARKNISKPSTFDEFSQKIKTNNTSEELPPSIRSTQKEPGMLSVMGSQLGSQQIAQPKNTIRQSISRPINSSNIKQELIKKQKEFSLVQLMSQMKTQKEQTELQKKQKEIEQARLIEQQSQNRISYERRLFKGGKEKFKVTSIQIPKQPIPTKQKDQSPKQQCPICQMDTVMVKSNTCHHAMCQQCWDKWLQVDLRCPICRGRVRRKFLVQQ